MYSNEKRCSVQIPKGVNLDSIMSSLEMGHGYHWTVLTRQPLLVAHGATIVGNMPELLLAGNETMIVAGGDAAYFERIRDVLDMLQRQSNRVRFSKEG